MAPHVVAAASQSLKDDFMKSVSFKNTTTSLYLLKQLFRLKKMAKRQTGVKFTAFLHYHFYSSLSKVTEQDK